MIIAARSARSESYLRAKYALAMVESTNNVAARNRVSTASGKYQFMRIWDPWFKRVCGRTWSSTVPKRKASLEAKQQADRDQEDLFDAYYELRVAPWIAWIRHQGLGKRFSDYELLAIYHRQGEYEAERYLRWGRDPNAGTHGNKHLKIYLTSVRRFYSRYHGYLSFHTAALDEKKKGFYLADTEIGPQIESDFNDF